MLDGIFPDPHVEKINYKPSGRLGRKRLREKKRGLEVYGHIGFQKFGGNVTEPDVLEDRGVVNKNTEPTEAFRGLRDKLPDVIRR